MSVGLWVFTPIGLSKMSLRCVWVFWYIMGVVFLFSPACPTHYLLFVVVRASSSILGVGALFAVGGTLAFRTSSGSDLFGP